MMFLDKLGNVREATVDMDKIRRVREYMTREKVCPVTGQTRYFNRIIEDSPFDNENMRRLADALRDPNQRSYPRKLRTLDESTIQERAEKFIEAQELENWLGSYTYGTIIRDKFSVECLKVGVAITVQELIDKIKSYVVANRENLEGTGREGSDGNYTENMQITVKDLVEYSLSMGWFYGDVVSIVNEGLEQDFSNRDIDSADSREYILFHCCQELEVLSRDSSNDEGVDGSVGMGPQTDIDTDHPDYLKQKGLMQSVLPRQFYRRVDWENPIAEHEAALLQKAYIDVFETEDMDPDQDRPRDIREPKTTWLGHYIDHVAMLKKARNCLPLPFWL